MTNSANESQSTQNNLSKSNESIFTLAAILILLAAFGFYTAYLLWGEWSYDQGFYFVVAKLMDRGHIPYSDIHMSEQPLMAWSVHWAYQLFGAIWGLQFFTVGIALLGVSALISIGRTLNGRLAGILAGFLLVLHFEFFMSVRTVNPETTSLSFGLLAIAMALKYCTGGKRYWLWLSAIAMAASFLFKLYMVTVVPLIALLIIFHPAHSQSLPKRPLTARMARIALDMILWGGIVAVILITVWAIIGFSAWWEQSIIFYVNRNAAHSRDLAFNLSKIQDLLSVSPILLVLVGWGLVRSIIQFRAVGWVVLAWTIFTFLFLMSFTPLRGKHLIMLIPVLALLAAIAISHIINLWQSQKKPVLKWGVAAAFMLALALLLVEISAPFQALAKPVRPLVKEEHQPIVDMLEKFTSPDDCLITDDPFVSFSADRLPPPWFSNMSYARFRSGSLSHQDLVDISLQYHCQAFVPTFSRIKNSDREFYNLAKGHFLRTWLVDGAEIMLGMPLESANPAIPVNVNFANQAELLGADLAQQEVSDTNYLYVSLYWKKIGEPFTENYKIFVQVRDHLGQVVVSGDHEMFDGLVPTQSWRTDTITKDTIRLTLPPELAPGNYTLYAGFYSPSTLERLPIINDTSGENAALFPEFKIK